MNQGAERGTPSVLRHPLAVLVAALGACAEPARDPNILLITLDTTRADHLGCYGYPLATSPNLDRLAEESVVYTRMYATTSWTYPSHASIFTGKLPSSHGGKHDPEGTLSLTQGIRGHPSWDRYRTRPIAADEVTLAEILRRRGYATGAAVAGPWMKRLFGLDAGFDHYDDEGVTSMNGRSAEDLTAAAKEWIAAQEEPFFLFLNYYDAHAPYKAPLEYRRRFLPPELGELDYRALIEEAAAAPELLDLEPAERMERAASDPELVTPLYDAEIAYMDHHLGVLFDWLRERGLYEDTWILVTADHGELLGERGLLGHGSSLTQPEIHIPLIVKDPGREPARGRNDALVQQTDVLPTILARLRIPPPPDLQGQPFDRVDHPIVAEVDPLPFVQEQNTSWRQQGNWRVLIDGDYKLVWGSLGRHSLHELSLDPLEATDLFESRSDLARTMERALTDYMDSLPEPGAPRETPEVDRETIETLERLGYVGGDEDR